MSQPAEKPGPGGRSPDRRSPVETLGVAGSGTVACGLAACTLARGGRVLVWARSDDSAVEARRRIASACERLGSAEEAGRLEIERELSGLTAATLVVEAVTEDEGVKRTVLGALGESLPAGSIIGTTTSSLKISALAGACGRPSSFFGLHVFNPVDRMELVELCFPQGADPKTRERAQAFCEAIGKTAVEVPDEAGFVVNRLLFPYLFDAVRLLERTGMRAEEVDACMRLGAAHPMGPLELLDLIGLDVAEAIGEALHAESRDQSHRPPERIRQLVGEGRLGRKTGAGFYSHT